MQLAILENFAGRRWRDMDALILGTTALCLAALGCGGDDKPATNPPAANSVAGNNSVKPGGSGGTVIIPTGGAGAAAKPPAAGTGTAGTTTPTAGASGTSTAGSSGGTPASGTGGTAGASGTTAGTTAGSGGGSGMDAGTPPDDDAGMTMCEPLQTPLDFTGAPKCSMDVCPAQDSICLPTTVVRAMVPQATVDMLAKCDDTNTCVPLSLAGQAGRQILPTCRSINDAEGRCLSSCVPQVALQKSQLPKSTCTGSDLCAPCYDPRTGEATGACTQGCDPGPTEPPKKFASCCSNRGLCVSPALAADQAPNLVRDTCGAEELCSPSELTDPVFKPKTCNSLDNAEGRCISTCVGGAVAKQRDRLPKADCGANEVCAPCYDPITGEDTGACTVNDDAPAKPKYAFARCCGEGDTSDGVCVTPELAGNQADILRQEDCDNGKLCAPVAKAKDPKYRFPTCEGLLGTGACVASCILDPLQSAILSRESCGQDEVCAPCEILGQPSGACE